MAHNLARWTARIGLAERTVTTKTIRRRVFALVGRITRSARRLTLHLPQHWPWETQFTRAIARLRAIYLPGQDPWPRHAPSHGCHLTGTQYLGIISFMDCSMCSKPIPEPRRLVVPHTLTCSPECSGERIRWRSRERAKLQRQRRKAANAAKRQKA